jgi:hypothetical protein
MKAQDLLQAYDSVPVIPANWIRAIFSPLLTLGVDFVECIVAWLAVRPPNLGLELEGVLGCFWEFDQPSFEHFLRCFGSCPKCGYLALSKLLEKKREIIKSMLLCCIEPLRFFFVV